jgi:hypothetical protein
MRHNVYSYTRATEASAAGWSDVPFYSDDLLPELQSTLAALADLEVHFEIARDSLEEWFGPEEDKQRRCAELEQAHRHAREARGVCSAAGRSTGADGSRSLATLTLCARAG